MSGGAAWADAMQALLLFAADPIGLGGIVVRAGAGPVSDHFLAMLLRALSPDTPVRRLPLHAGDDRLLGGLDLAATLQAGRPVAQTGLLAEANGGVVVVPMAERIDAGMAARLRAVIDEGVVALQRDGLSRVLPASFGIVALDEGAEPDERPPASLLDRMAFHIDLTSVSLGDLSLSGHGSPPPSWVGSSSPSWPDAPSPSWPDAPSPSWPGLSGPPIAAPAGIDDPDRPNQDTQRNGPKPPTAFDPVETLSHAALALGVDSPRALLFAIRTARLAAALSHHPHITDTDLGVAGRLVLAPRATRFPAPEQTEAPPDPQPGEHDTPDQEKEQEIPPDQPLADVILEAAKAALPPDLLARLTQPDGARGLVRTPGRAGQLKTSTKRGRPVGTIRGDPKAGARLHLLETLKAAAPWQALRRNPEAPDRFQVRRDDFRIIRFRQRLGSTTVFAVDASGSAAMHRLGEAKGAVELLLADCYVRRDQVALLAFRGNAATLLLPPTGSLLRAKRCLASLPGGGPTPLATGIEAAMALAATIHRTGRTPVITLLTDARANIARDGTAGRPRAEAEALESARAIRATGIASLLVDTSPRPNPFARRLADEMRAQYVPLPYADASALSQAVRSAVTP